MAKGIDCSTPLTAATAAKLAAAGYGFAARYLVPQGYAKRITRAEAEAITGAGMQIVSVFETSAARPKGGAKNGYIDGAAAYREALNIGQPKGTAIYFTCDWDANERDFDSIEAYLRAAASQIPGYEARTYSEYDVLEEMIRRGAVKYGWQTYAWSQGKRSARASIYQHQNNVMKAGILVDLNESYGNEGWWCTKEEPKLSKYIPTVTKERIVMSAGRLRYIPLVPGKPYAIKATDIRLIRIPHGRARFRFVSESGARVSQLARKYGADIAINFPFFNAGKPLGDAEDQDRRISSGYGKMLKWHELASVNGTIEIGQLDKAEHQDFLVQASPLLVENGKPVWAQYAEIDQTAEDIVGTKKSGFKKRQPRTFVGVTSGGDFLIAVADGRTRTDQGLTLEEMAQYMIDKGAVTALNGDGGSSSILWTSFSGKYAPYGIDFKAGSLNQPLNTGANERPVNHALLMYLI